MVKKGKNFNRIFAVILSAVVLLHSPACMNPVYAEPTAQEAETSVSENITGSENEIRTSLLND